MKNILFLATIFLMVVTGSLGGRITSWGDADIVFPNSGRVQYMNLYFQLDNKLPAGHVMRVTLPFATTLALNSSSSVGASIVYTASSASKGTYLSTSSLTTAATVSFNKLSASAPYTAYFYFSADLAAATPYVFKLVFTTSPTDTGFVGYVQMETMSPALSVSTSSGSDTAISYDLNNAFAPVQLFAAPGNLTAWNITSDSNSLVGGATSARQLSFVASQNFFYWPLIQMTWDNTGFTISNISSIDTGINTTAVNPLTYGSNAGQYWTTQNTTTLNIYHNQILLTNQTVKYNFTTANPSGTTSQTIQFSLRIMHRYNLNLTDVATTNVSFIIANTSAPSSSVTTVTIPGVSILLSWGIDPAVSTLTANTYLTKVFQVMASTAGAATYQALRFVWGTNNTLSSQAYRVALTICNSLTNCDVLENSVATSFSTTACWVTIDSTARKVYCNTSSIATSGNYIAARVWYLGGATAASGILTGASGYAGATTFSDSTVGTIVISVPTNSSFSSITGTLSSSYNSVTYNYNLLANLNGNGPMVAVPYNTTNTASVNYTTIWTGSDTTWASLTTSGAQTAWPVATLQTAPNFGGIYGATSTNAKYHAALYTTGTWVSATGRNTLTGQTGTADLSTVTNPGLDIFMNPNIYSNVNTNGSITSCWVHNLPKTNSADTPYSGTAASGTGATGGVNGMRASHCFSASVTTTSQTYFRLRNIVTAEAIAALTISTTAAANAFGSLDSTANTLYLSFFWENAFQVNSSYAGASLKADTMINDFYGISYTIAFLAVANNPARSGLSTATDIGELSGSISNLAASTPIVVGTPFFWSQPFLMPFSSYKLGTDNVTPYYKGVSAFLNGMTVGTYTSATALNYIRIRGVLTSSSGTVDYGTYPTTGRLAIFIQIPVSGTVFEPLGPVNFTNYAGSFNNYNTAGGPLVGNGAVRCWSTGTLGNCLHDRNGRALTVTIKSSTLDGTTGVPNALDLYQIISSDANYTSNFSLVIVVKPKSFADAADVQKYLYRLAFISSSTGYYYIQHWDNYFMNAWTNTSGVMTRVTTPTPTAAASVVMMPASSSTACTVAPFSSSSTTVPSIRLNPATNETDNTLVTSTNFLAQAWTSVVNTTAATTTLQGSFTWCVQWNFKQGAFSIGSNAFENTIGDKCIGFDYLGYESNAYINWYCIYCPVAASILQINTGSAVNITLSNFFTGPATNIYNASFHNIVENNGNLLEVANCPSISGNSSATNTTLWIPQTIATTGVSTSYNVSAQKVTIAFTTPSTLATSIVDSITFQGKNQSSSGSDTAFPYATLDTAYVCKIVPTTLVNNQSLYLGCGATLASGLLTVTPTSGAITGSTYGYVTAWTVIIWGLNGNNYTATTLPNTTYFVITTYKGTTVVDQSNTTNTSYAIWSLSTVNNIYFTTPSIGYQRNIIGARGWFRFDITFAQRPWFNTDKVIINLDAVVSSTVNINSSVIKCRITDTSDAIQQIFQSCTLALTATPPTATIVALPQSSVYGYEVILAQAGVRLYLENMVTLTAQTNKTIYGSITFVGSGAGTNTALSKLANTTDFTPVNLTSLAFPTGYPTLTKYWSNANDFQDLSFGLYSNTSFNSSCRITIVFPSYYNPGLTVRSERPYCTINNVYSQCLVGTVTSTGTFTLSQGQRSLVLYGSATAISNGSLVVRVSGISAPPASYATETFWIQMNGDNSESTSSIVYCGSLSDTAYAAPSNAVLPLNVIWFGVGATTTRTFVTFYWSIYLNNATATVNTTSAVQVIFPESYGAGWGVFTPVCQVTDFTNASAIYTSAGTANQIGNLVNMNVSTAIPAGSIFNVTCTNVRTQNLDAYYQSQDVTIRIVDANGSYVNWRAAPGQDNVNYTSAFAKGSAQTYVSWFTTTSITSPGALVAGTYSYMVTATVPAKSSRSFIITISDSRFAFLSATAPFWIVTGTTTNSTQLGCSGSVPIGLYGLTFSINDNTTTYIAPPTMWIAVNTNPIAITPSVTTLSAFYSSSSLSSTSPVTFDLTAYPPFSDITITPVAPTGNTNFTFSPAFIKITPTAPKNYFTFTSTSAATVAASAVYSFTITGTNAVSYTLSSSVTVSLATDSGTGTSQTPVLAVTADSTDSSAATSKTISFTLSQVTQANIYWVVTLQGQSITDATNIMTNAANLVAYNANSANQAQYSTFYQTTTTKSQTISNLFPSTGYTVTAIAVSNTNKTSTVASFTFVTGANAAVIQRWLFNYTVGTYPSQAQRQALLCSLTQNLAIPAINVRTVHGEICGNTTAFYSTVNSTGDLGVYFYPLQASSDATMTAAALQTALNSTSSNVLSSMNTTLSAGTTGIGWQSAFIDLASIRNAVPGISIPTSIPTSQLTSSSVYFSYTATNDTGFVFLTLASNSTATPTAIQMKQAAANITSISGAISTQVFYFYPGATISYNFTGLSAATSYNIFAVASNNDPSFLQNFTSVQSFTVTTPSVGSGTTSGQIGVVFSVIAVFASIISLMFF